MDELIGVALSAAMVAFTLGWLGACLLTAVKLARRHKEVSAAALKGLPRQEMYWLAFYRDDSGLWAIGDTESQARELAVQRWRDLGAGLSAEATAGDPTPEEWARGLVLVYVEVESEAVLRENVLCAVRDGDLAYAPWSVDATWEEA